MTIAIASNQKIVPTRNVIVASALYIGTGIIQPILIDSLRIHSCLGRRWLLLPTLANVMGMASCGILASSDDWKRIRQFNWKNNNNNPQTQPWRRMIYYTAAVDLISGMLLTGGILLTGGAVFVVLYNSCPAWTALLSKYVLGKELNVFQSMGVVIVCCGLSAHIWFGSSSSSSASDNSQNDVDSGASSSGSSTVLIGSIIVLLGSVLHSGFFVLSEISLRRSDNRNSNDSTSPLSVAPVLSPPLLSCCLGCIETICMTLWISLGVAFWGFQEEEQQHLTATPTTSSLTCSMVDFIKGFVMLLLVDAVHAGAFFLLLEKIGAVGSALMKGIQAVAVVILSATFFCGVEDAQCLTPEKAGSMMLVLTGVMCYAIGSSRATSTGSSMKQQARQQDQHQTLQQQQHHDSSKEMENLILS